MALHDEENCAFLLPELPMTNEIHGFPGDGLVAENETRSVDQVVGEGPTCGLIPIVSRCEEVVTTGLKWSLEGDTPLE